MTLGSASVTLGQESTLIIQTSGLVATLVIRAGNLFGVKGVFLPPEAGSPPFIREINFCS